jgi:hypothetical protein
MLARVDRFKVVVLDFQGVERIGQAFADQAFRVFTRMHPEIEIVAINTVTAVDQMIERARLRSEGRLAEVVKRRARRRNTPLA